MVNWQALEVCNQKQAINMYYGECPSQVAKALFPLSQQRLIRPKAAEQRRSQKSENGIR